MLNPFNRTLQGVFWQYWEKAVPLHCHSKKGCTRYSSSKLDSALVCTFFALSLEERLQPLFIINNLQLTINH